MKISDILSMSLSNLWRRKTRSLLTILGVIIGTSSIVVMMSLGIGLKSAMMQEVSSAGGLTEVMVYSDEGSGSEALLLDDKTINQFKNMEHVKSVDPQIAFSTVIQSGKYESYITLIGITEECLEDIALDHGKLPSGKSQTLSMVAGNQVINDFYDNITGEYFAYDSESEEPLDIDLVTTNFIAGIEHEEKEQDSGVDDSESESMLDSTDSTFSSGNKDDDKDDSDDEKETIDQSLTFDSVDTDYSDNTTESNSAFTSSMRKVPIKITGVSEGDSETYTEYSYNCYTEIEGLKKFLKDNYKGKDIIPGQPTNRNGDPYRDLKYTQLTVHVDKAENVEDVLQTIQNMGYQADANKEWLEETEKQFMIIEAVLGAIGGVAMLVAAISIANTMTMSTYERTKEIGIMKVLGCELKNIRGMFLAEAAFIGFFGGFVGLVFSFILSFVVNKVAPSLVADLTMSSSMKISHIPVWLMLAALFFSTLIGMLAGFFPAQRATKLSPLAAIRTE